MAFRIRKAERDDLPEWVRMRRTLWPDETAEGEHEREAQAYFAAPRDGVTFVAERASGGLAGFVEISLRNYAEGCRSQPVPYIEGWYVDTDLRRQGVGGALIRAAEAWAVAAGYREMASDAEPENEVSLQAHRALGYEEVGRAVCFRRALRA